MILGKGWSRLRRYAVGVLVSNVAGGCQPLS
jgi:hypothetical protein